MAIKTTTNIDIDFCNKKYVLVNAKQLDKNSRFLLVTCYNHGELFSLNSGEHAAYIRYRKADDYGVFNNCDIDRFGKIIVELTEQMLAADGICYADLIIVNKGDAVVDPNTGKIDEKIENASILSTMTFCIDVSEVPVMNSEIESTYEFILLNDNLEKYWADFEDVMKTSKSWAVGHTGIRDGENTNNSEYWATQSQSWAVGNTDERSGEDTNNSKYWSEQSNDSADKSESYAVGGTGTRENEDVDNAEYYSQMSKSYAMGGTGIVARDGEDTNNAEYYSRLAKSYTMGDFDGSTGIRDNENTENAKTYMENARAYMESADDYMKTTEGYKNEVNEYKATVDGYMKTTEGYMESTDGYMSTTEGYMDKAEEYMQSASDSESKSATSETNALNSANRAQSYAVGGTGTRDGEDTNNAQWYYNEIKDILNGLNIVFVPKGTIYFSELATVKETAVAGYIYNIKDDFVTDETFREGSGVTYTAGTNVYYVIDENGEYKWDALGGAASPTATVSEVKDYLGINEEIDIV